MTLNEAQTEAVEVANAHLTNVGLPSYDELVGLLERARRLGLTFDIGSAYIRRSYIDEQTALVAEIKAIPRRQQSKATRKPSPPTACTEAEMTSEEKKLIDAIKALPAHKVFPYPGGVTIVVEEPNRVKQQSVWLGRPNSTLNLAAIIAQA